MIIRAATGREARDLLLQIFKDNGFEWEVTKKVETEGGMISTQESYQWCVDRFGPALWRKVDAGMQGGYALDFDPNATWGFINSDFYFRYQEDATLFRMFWGSEG